ncbi:hypothetical protein ACUODJ_45770, partial [Escherichia sp. HC-CC]
TSYVVGQALKADKIKLTDMVTVGKDAEPAARPRRREEYCVINATRVSIQKNTLYRRMISSVINNAHTNLKKP